MKAIETVQYEGKVLGVLVETKPQDETKGYVSYFIDGIEITDWGRIAPRYRRILTALADNLCEVFCLTKWSY
jgi:hypothetical protein